MLFKNLICFLFILNKFIESHSPKNYQQKLIDDTAMFRGKRYIVGIQSDNKENISTFSGPWIEERFFNYWIENKPDIDRIYIPIQWTGSELITTIKEKEDNDMMIQHIINNLSRNNSYFTIIQIARDFKITLNYLSISHLISISLYMLLVLLLGLK